MKKNHLPDYEIMVSAINGDYSSIQALRNFYTPYMEQLATEQLYDQYGNVRFYKNEELFKDLEIKLIVCTLRFKLK